MKSKFIILYLIMPIVLNCCCNHAGKESIAAVRIKFEGLTDSDMSQAWIIETER